MKTAALILSAGNSSRMGLHKAELKFDENYIFLEKIIEQYKIFGCRKIFIVLNSNNEHIFDKLKDEYKTGCTKIINHFPENGRFSSIKAGFSKMPEMENVFIHNIDNPFVNNDILGKMLYNFEVADYYVPTFEGKGGHPVLVNDKIIKEAANFPDTTNFKEFLNNFKRMNIETEYSEILININNLEEYNKYFRNQSDFY